MDNFKGQITIKVRTLLEENNILVAYFLPNSTDLLQPLDVSVNKPAKSFLNRKFQEWYAEEIFKQLEGLTATSRELEPVDLTMPVVKELCSKWIVEMFDYISSNPHMIVNGFLQALSKSTGDDTDEESSSDDTVTNDTTSEQHSSDSASEANDSDSDAESSDSTGEEL